MKKISLKSLKSEEVLSREELKQIIGGVAGSGDPGETKCYESACKIVYTNGNGVSTTFDGSCSSNSSGCFCDIGQPGDIDLSSNGGVSRCTI